MLFKDMLLIFHWKYYVSENILVNRRVYSFWIFFLEMFVNITAKQ